MISDFADGAGAATDRLDGGRGELRIGTRDVRLELAQECRDVRFVGEIRQNFQLQQRLGWSSKVPDFLSFTFTFSSFTCVGSFM